VNSAPKRKAEGLENGAATQPQAAATTISGSGHSSKLASVAEPSSSGGTLSDTVANSFLSGVVSDSARSTSPHGGSQAWGHNAVASGLQANRERTVICSRSQGAYPPLTRSHPAVLYSQRTVNPLRTTPIYPTSSFQHASSLSSMIAQPADPRGPHTSSEPMQPCYPYQDVGCHSPALMYPGDSQHSPISTVAAARIHSDSSALDPVVPQPSLAPPPSMYWFLFDNDDNSVGLHKDASRSPSRPLGNADNIAPRTAANPTPISFLAKWEDMLVLERRIRSSFEANLGQIKQTQPLESGQTNQDDQEVSMKESGEFLFYFLFFGYCGTVLRHWIRALTYPSRP
jgi:hypothetical protein